MAIGRVSYLSRWKHLASKPREAAISIGVPSIPSGFALHTITCTVAVYTMAGGVPVSNATIIGGQTWFVSPTPVKDAQGKLWTEIFVGGFTDGFIPTSCVL